MSDPTDMPFQRDDEPSDSIYEGQAPVPAHAVDSGADRAAVEGQDTATGAVGDAAARSQLPDPEPTETDRLAGEVTGPEDHEGMTSLWRATMDLPHWWFIAVGDPGIESPAAAQIAGQLMLLTFTGAERARHFAVQNGMVAPDEDLRAIALAPAEVVDSAQTYREAGIGGLMFDPHISGYFMPSDQLSVVWDAVRGSATDTQG